MLAKKEYAEYRENEHEWAKLGFNQIWNLSLIFF